MQKADNEIILKCVLIRCVLGMAQLRYRFRGIYEQIFVYADMQELCENFGANIQN